MTDFQKFPREMYNCVIIVWRIRHVFTKLSHVKLSFFPLCFNFSFAFVIFIDEDISGGLNKDGRWCSPRCPTFPLHGKRVYFQYKSICLTLLFVCLRSPLGPRNVSRSSRDAHLTPRSESGEPLGNPCNHRRISSGSFFFPHLPPIRVAVVDREFLGSTCWRTFFVGHMQLDGKINNACPSSNAVISAIRQMVETV